MTIDPNSQWKPVPIKQEMKDDDCQNPPPTKKSRHSPPDSLPLAGGPRTPQSSNGSGHYSPYQTQPPSNPGMLAHTSPDNTPGGPRSQEHVANTAPTPSAGTFMINILYQYKLNIMKCTAHITINRTFSLSVTKRKKERNMHLNVGNLLLAHSFH